MLNREIDKDHWEKVGWQYYQRYLKLCEMRTVVANELEAQVNNSHDNLHDLLGVLLTPPHILEGIVLATNTRRIEILSNSNDAARAIIKASHAAAIFRLLIQAASEGGVTRFINIDEKYPVPFVVSERPLDLQGPISLVENRWPEFLGGVSELGRKQGSEYVLGLIERADTPLRYWGLDVAMKRMNLQPAIDGGFIGTLPSGIEGLDMRYYYPLLEKKPQCSLVVTPLEDY